LAALEEQGKKRKFARGEKKGGANLPSERAPLPIKIFTAKKDPGKPKTTLFAQGWECSSGERPKEGWAEKKKVRYRRGVENRIGGEAVGLG